ncbi:hypothetical protein ACLI1A_00080 [Flavobacterium sp. RHBU_3]|uniref:hypothetical protein n=1 Tax=Flavobacterium sp. RHBU_3 TaxID=3391184 RepID=UPI00398529A6
MKPYNGRLKDHENFKILFENTVMVVGHIFENSYCINKLTQEEFGIFEFYSDPTCGLIGKNNDWCLVGGEVLILKTYTDKTLRVIEDLKHIFELRAIDDYSTQILTDPWDEASAIWHLTIDLKKPHKPVSINKIRNFKDYLDKPYTENVEW